MVGVKAPRHRASGEYTRHPTQNRPSSHTATLRHPATGAEAGRAEVADRAEAAGAAVVEAAAAGAVAGAGVESRKRTTALYLHVKKELLCLSRRIAVSEHCYLL